MEDSKLCFCVAVFFFFTKWFWFLFILCFRLVETRVHISIALWWVYLLSRSTRSFAETSSKNDYCTTHGFSTVCFSSVSSLELFRQGMCVVLEWANFLPSTGGRVNCKVLVLLGLLLLKLFSLWCAISFLFDLGEFVFSWVNGHIISWFGWFVAVFYYVFCFV